MSVRVRACVCVCVNGQSKDKQKIIIIIKIIELIERNSVDNYYRLILECYTGLIDRSHRR